MMKVLISAVRPSRLLPKFISAANNIHFSGSLHFKFLKPFASEASARREFGDCHAARYRALAIAQLDQFSRRIALDRLERSRTGKCLFGQPWRGYISLRRLQARRREPFVDVGGGR